MKTLDERITEAEGALEEAKASDDAARQARAEARLETLQEANEYHSKEFERVGKKMRSEGGEAREKAIADEFGVPLEEAKQMIADYREIQSATETETEAERKAREKAEGERDSLREERDNALALASQRLIQSELKASLIGEGARKDRLARLIREADLSQVEVEENEVKNLEPVIAALKADIPEWFGSSVSDIDATPPASDPNSLSSETKQQNRELASRQIHNMF